jgi:tetratricopeptide (TPR) repeat protein
MKPRFNRRQFLTTSAGLACWPRFLGAAEVIPIVFRKPDPLLSERSLIEPGADGFASEEAAVETEAALARLLESKSITMSRGFTGQSPWPARWERVAGDVQIAVYGGNSSVAGEEIRRWVDSLGEVKTARFYSLPGDIVRFEIASRTNLGLQYGTGSWRVRFAKGAFEELAPIEEVRVTAAEPWFEEITGHFPDHEQLKRGVPYWRARLDPACGIDVYGNNGIAVGDIDGDGWDEIYVCQPGGLPNRLLRRNTAGKWEDITEAAGVGVLDYTASALFLDLRNTGRQDLVVLTTGGPLLFLQNQRGRFEYSRDAFRFQRAPQGTFTGMAAADYDGDGHLDLYLCTYIYFQSEDQYRYPAPYHDAQNGPPNFLFRNRLKEAGYFEDVTDRTGLGANNNRYSFAAAWCDYNGDGRPDLYVANDFGRNNLYRNEGETFRDAAAEAGVEDLGPGMSAAWFDYDGDARPDLYVANMWTAAGMRVAAESAFQPVSRGGLAEAYRRHSKGNSLYRNLGDGSFADTGKREGVEMGRWAWSADGMDFDNDGAPEIYVACGMLTGDKQPDLISYFWRRVVAESSADPAGNDAYERGWNSINQFIREGYSWSGNEANVFYARRGGRYWDFSGVSGIDFAGDSRAFAFTDLDGDGTPGLVVKNRLGPQVRAFRATGARKRNRIAFDLTGVKSNRDAIGAKIEVRHSGGGVTRWLSAGSGYLSQHTKRVFVGMGEYSKADLVRITWPSGAVQELKELDAGYRYRIVEGRTDFERTPFAAPPPAPSRAVEGDNTPALAEAWLLTPLPLPFAPAKRGAHVLSLVESGEEVPGSYARVDLDKASEQERSCWALLRRYLFDYRTGLRPPLSFLVDEAGRIHKVYAAVPAAAAIQADMKLISHPDRQSLALPFPGRYYRQPGRNLYRLAAAFLAAGYAEQALPYLAEEMRQSPDNAKALLAAGQIHLELGRLAEARQYLTRSLELNPAQAETHNALGGVAMAEGRHQDAVGHFEQALKLRPAASYAVANAAQAYARLGQRQRAEQLFRKALDLDPGDVDSWNQLGLLQARQGRHSEARDSFQKAIARKRDHAGAINNLGVLYVQMGQVNDAIAAFTYGRQAAPDDENICLNLARVYVQTGDRERARRVLEEFAARHPANDTVRKAVQDLEKP